MKKIFYFLLLLFIAYTPLSANAQNNFIVSSTYFIDDNNLSYARALNNQALQPITKTYLGYIHNPVWSQYKLYNNTNEEQKLIFRNARHGIWELDLYVFDSNNTLEQTYFMGAGRDIENRPSPHRQNIIQITLKPHEACTVLVKTCSMGPIDLSWDVISNQEFIPQSIKESMFWGLFGGLMLAIMIYNTILYINIKHIAFLYYIGACFMSLLFTYALYGTFYVLDLGINLYVLFTSTWITPQLMMMFFVLFAKAFFDTKTTMPIINIMLNFLMSAFVAISAVFLVGGIKEQSLLRFYEYVTPFFYFYVFLTVIIGINGIKKKIRGAKYYLTGQILFILFNFAQLIILLGYVNLQNWMSFLGPIGVICDLLFLSVALGSIVGEMNERRKNNEIAIFNNARFVSIGKAVGDIVHQWKVPLSHIGALTMQLDDMARNEEHIERTYLKKCVSNLQDSVDFMTNTAIEIGDFYKNDQKTVNFCVNSEIKKIVAFLHGRLQASNVSIEIIENEQIAISGYRYSFLNAIITILDNALEVFEERDVKKPKLKITIEKIDSDICINIQDNGGGILIKPIDSIFKYAVSSKTNGSGLGLCLAKNIIEEKLNGSIFAYNIDDGAMFKIIIRQ